VLPGTEDCHAAIFDVGQGGRYRLANKTSRGRSEATPGFSKNATVLRGRTVAFFVSRKSSTHDNREVDMDTEQLCAP